MNRIQIYRFLSISLFFFLLWTTGCNKLELQSQKRTADIGIDGSPSEWEGKLKHLEYENVSFGVQNDDEFLYLCLVSEDPESVQQIMGLGLTIWFDPEGGQKKAFGINYPLGMNPSIHPLVMGAEGNRGDISANQDKYLSELEFLYLDQVKNHREYLIALKGLNLKITNEGGKLVYELKVPFQSTKDHPIAINSDRTKPLGIYLKAGEIKTKTIGGRSGVPSPRAALPRSGGGRGAPGGAPGAGSGGPSTEEMKPIDVWVTVKLTP